MASDEYVVAAGKALSAMQFVEESLRMYLSRVFDLVRKRLKGLVGFDWNYEDLQKDSMGRLISEFERYCHEEGLADRLRRLTEERNFFAHESFLLQAGQWSDSDRMQILLARAEQAHKEADECFRKVMVQIAVLDKLLKRLP